METAKEHYKIVISPYDIKKFAEVELIIYQLMKQLDTFFEADGVPDELKTSKAYTDAEHALGWDVDWEELHNASQ